MERCEYVNLDNPRYIAYHDGEWGKPLHDDRALFELLVLECFQAGLSWECVLNKRPAFRAAFGGFHPEQVAAYGEADVERLAADAGIIRNQAKIRAAITNAQAFLAIQREFGSFDAYLWNFTDGKVLHIDYRAETTSALSDELSRDLKRRGMKFVGSTVAYSYLQAAGVINPHSPACDLFMPALSIRDATQADHPFILAQNRANVEVLSPLEAAKLSAMEREAELVWIVEANGMPAGFLIAFREGADYGSENYRWFSARYGRFLYIDRVVTDAAYRGKGVGRTLYQAVFEHACTTGVPLVTAEIDTAPVRNEGSLRFHAAMGFREVGTQRLSDGKTVVSLQERAG